MVKIVFLPFEKIEDAPFQIGVKCRMIFKNGYGVSVVSHTHSYGGKDGLFEIILVKTLPKGEYTFNYLNTKMFAFGID